MTDLGKCMVFYFKYLPEMQRLYWKKQTPDEFADLKTQTMVNAIGDKCCLEVSEFLTECGKVIENHFSTIGKCLSLHSHGGRKWRVSYGVWSKTVTRPHSKRWKMRAGVDIPKDSAEILPWLWGFGGADAEERMVDLFRGAVRPRSADSDIDLDLGTVALARIPIPVTQAQGFEIDRDGLLKQVGDAFSGIGEVEFGNVYQLVRLL